MIFIINFIYTVFFDAEILMFPEKSLKIMKKIKVYEMVEVRSFAMERTCGKFHLQLH